MSTEDWLDEILAQVKPLTTAQRDVLIPAFKQGAAAASLQEAAAASAA